MNTYLKTTLLAISAGFIGLGCSAQVRSQERMDVREPIVLEIQSFFKTPIGPKGFEMTEGVIRASGQTVRLSGYMVKKEMPTLGAFMLTPRPVQMSEHADGEANDLPAAFCWVYLDPKQANWTVPHVPGLVTVEGQFSVTRREDSEGSVAWFHLQLAPDAIRAVQAEVPFNQRVSHSTHSH